MFCDLLLRFWEAVNDGKGGFLRFRRFCFVLHKFASSTRQIHLNFWVFVFTLRAKIFFARCIISSPSVLCFAHYRNVYYLLHFTFVYFLHFPQIANLLFFILI
jgi:hypothetical protein